MSVKHALLALLSAAPSSTYQLRKRFDASTGQGLPLNIGQVSSTLQRLERDGLVARDEEPTAAGDTQTPGSAGQLWRLLPAGSEELAAWWASPVVAEERGRDELVLKLTLAVVTPEVDLPALLQLQRAATQRSMHDFTRVRRELASDDLVARLVVDHHIFIAEAELRWLDDAEAAILRASVAARRAAAQGRAADSTGPQPQSQPQSQPQPQQALPPRPASSAGTR